MLTCALMFGHQILIWDFCTTLVTFTNIQSLAIVIFVVLLTYYSQRAQLYALTKWLG